MVCFLFRNPNKSAEAGQKLEYHATFFNSDATIYVIKLEK